MASSPVDIQIRQALQKLKKESAQLTIECQLKKHLTIIKDLIGSGIAIATIADRLSQAGITGNIKDIIAAINALVGTETSIDADKDDDQKNKSSQPLIIEPVSTKKPPKQKNSAGIQEPPTPPLSIDPIAEEISISPPELTPNTQAATSENPYNVTSRRNPTLDAKIQAEKALKQPQTS